MNQQNDRMRKCWLFLNVKHVNWGETFWLFLMPIILLCPPNLFPDEICRILKNTARSHWWVSVFVRKTSRSRRRNAPGVSWAPFQSCLDHSWFASCKRRCVGGSWNAQTNPQNCTQQVSHFMIFYSSIISHKRRKSKRLNTLRNWAVASNARRVAGMSKTVAKYYIIVHPLERLKYF